jgi:hypothetical protein
VRLPGWREISEVERDKIGVENGFVRWLVSPDQWQFSQAFYLGEFL